MRIDKHLAQRFGSRTKAARAIEDGEVLVNGKRVDCSYDVKDTDIISFIEKDSKFVSMGGYKLEKALNDFSFDVAGKVFADIGASTGGFTDCLLKNGAKKVFCIDVGERQLDMSLRDKNIDIIDNFNARELHASLFDCPLDGVVVDCSFISLTYLLEAISSVLPSGGSLIALIKPQFELDKASVGKGGIVKDRALHVRAIERVYDSCLEYNLAPEDITTAPLHERKTRNFCFFAKREEWRRRLRNC